MKRPSPPTPAVLASRLRAQARGLRGDAQRIERAADTQAPRPGPRRRKTGSAAS